MGFAPDPVLQCSAGEPYALVRAHDNPKKVRPRVGQVAHVAVARNDRHFLHARRGDEKTVAGIAAPAHRRRTGRFDGDALRREGQLEAWNSQCITEPSGHILSLKIGTTTARLFNCNSGFPRGNWRYKHDPRSLCGGDGCEGGRSHPSVGGEPEKRIRIEQQCAHRFLRRRSWRSSFKYCSYIGLVRSISGRFFM